MAATAGCTRLTSRSCLVPKIFFRRLSIMPSHYTGCLPDRRPSGCDSTRSGSPPGRPRPAVRGHGARAACVSPSEHPRDLRHPGLARERLDGRPRAPAADGLGHAQVMARPRGDLGQVRHAEDLPALGHHAQAVADHRRRSGHRSPRRPRRRSRWERRRPRPARRGGPAWCGTALPRRPPGPAPSAPRPGWRRAETPRGRSPAATAPSSRSSAIRKSPRSMPRARISRSTSASSRRAAAALPSDSSLGGRLQLRLKLALEPLLLGDHLVVTRQPLQLGGGRLAEGEHGLHALAVLSLESRDDLQALLDLLQTARIDGEALAQPANRAQRLVEQHRRRIERLGRRGERHLQPTELAQDSRRTAHAGERRALGRRRAEPPPRRGRPGSAPRAAGVGAPRAVRPPRRAGGERRPAHSPGSAAGPDAGRDRARRRAGARVPRSRLDAWREGPPRGSPGPPPSRSDRGSRAAARPGRGAGARADRAPRRGALRVAPGAPPSPGSR